MISLSNLNGYELITLANIFTILISKELSSDEIIAYANFFTIVGDSLSAISASSDYLCDKTTDKNIK